jgi:hypothetical protein
MRLPEHLCNLRAWYRAFALALVVALAFTPICSSVCQARTCLDSSAGNLESDCHHAQGMNAEDTLRITAAGKSCGLHELQVGLPAARSNLEAIVAPASSPDSSVFFAALSTDARVLSHSAFPRDTGPKRVSRRFVAVQFSFDTFIFLRV